MPDVKGVACGSVWCQMWKGTAGCSVPHVEGTDCDSFWCWMLRAWCLGARCEGHSPWQFLVPDVEGTPVAVFGARFRGYSPWPWAHCQPEQPDAQPRLVPHSRDHHCHTSLHPKPAQSHANPDKMESVQSRMMWEMLGRRSALLAAARLTHSPCFMNM